MSTELQNAGAGDSQPPGSSDAELVLLIAGQAQRVPVPVAITTSAMALLVSEWVTAAVAGTWLAIVFAITLTHTWYLRRMPGVSSLTDAAKLNRCAATFTVHGSALASLLIFFPFVPIAIGAVITIFIVGVCAATLHATAGYMRIYLPYCLVTMGPTAAMWTFAPIPDAGPQDRVIFATLCAAYVGTMIGHARGAYGVFLDSYKIRLQRESLNVRLRDALNQAESSSLAKTRFLASASHDLRQPIHALSLFTGALRMRQLDHRSQEMVVQVEKAVGVLVSQLDALLDISRLDAGVVRGALRSVDLAGLLTQLAEEFRPQAQRKGLELRLVCPECLHTRTDPALLYRVLGNLLANAVKYTAAGRVDLIAEAVGGECVVTVADTGPGIAAEEQEKVFEEFYQVNNPERDRSQGLGLGLAIVQRISGLLEMPLHLHSIPGEGTRVTLTLVVVARGEDTMQTGIEARNAPSDLQVLVVDDEESIRLGMKTLLEEMGYGVQLASSTESAVLASRHAKPSVVLADLRLRGRDSGMSTIRALREQWPDLPALLISGDTAPERLREAHGAGIELLHKPVSSPQLRESILKAVRP